MNEEQLGTLVSSWLKEGNRPPSDPNASVRTAMNAASETRQLRRWRWLPPFVHRMSDPPSEPHAVNETTDYQPNPILATNGHTPTVIGRTQSMLSPAKAITAGAIVAAVGGVFLIAQPFQQQGSVPGVTSPFELEVQDGSSYFTGELIWEGALPIVGGEETIVDGVLQARGTLAEGDAIEVSDPRVSGPLTVALNADVHKIGDSEIIMFRTLGWRIENDGGAWSGQGTALVHGSDAVDDTEISTVVLTGEGDYEGHTLYLIVDSGGDGPFPIEGAVFVGEAPPFPAPPAPTE